MAFTHGYDQTNRRVSLNVNDSTWLLYPAAAGSTAYTANALNQYSAVGSVTPTYDGNGNLTFDGTFSYAYDAENRLTSITQGGTAIASYAYDGRGRRKSKTVGGTTTLFVTDADNREVLEYAGSGGAVGNWYAYGLGSNEVLNRMNVAAGTRATMIPDIQGSIVATLDSGSGALSKAGYLAFGENPGSLTGTFRFTGQRFDAETGGATNQPSGLYYYRARMYSPTLGRFMQPDPVGYQSGVNLYAYVGNDPLNATDPSGLDTLQAQIALSGRIGVGVFSFAYQYQIGIAVDNSGNIGVFHSYGGGAAAGLQASLTVGGAYSNAKIVSDLLGLFANGSAAGGAGATASADVFTGPSVHGTVVGAGGSYGVGAGAAASVTVTNTDFLAQGTLGSLGRSIFSVLSPAASASPGASSSPAAK